MQKRIKKAIIHTDMVNLTLNHPMKLRHWDFTKDWNARVRKKLVEIDDWEKVCRVEIRFQSENNTPVALCSVLEVLPTGQVIRYTPEKLDAFTVEAEIISLIQADLCMVADIEYTEEDTNTRYAFLVMEGDVSPSVMGPFKDELERDEAMKLYREHNGDEDGLYFIEYTGEFSISAASGSFFDE